LAFWFRNRSGSSREVFDREVLPHLESLYATAMRLTRNDRDAEDLVQDTVLRAFHSFHRYEPGTTCRAWLFKILHNLFIDRYRRKVQERDLLEQLRGAELAEARPGEDYDEEFVGRLLSDDVRGALDSLPEEFRTVVVLCDLEEFSYREIADVVGCPVGTVMSRLHRGRRLLQAKLREYAIERGILKAPGGEGGNVIPIQRSER
jgi:RNA polymerase sigma-70 factor, ECF subfamily